MMMKLLAATTLACVTHTALAVATVGQPAPTFTVQDTSGKSVSLAEFKGKHVVLEWVNPGCPYVVKHYGSANMQGTQKEAATKGVVWLAVNSTATEHGDYKAPAAMAQWMQGHRAAASATFTGLVAVATSAGLTVGLLSMPPAYTSRPFGSTMYRCGVVRAP